MVYGYLQNYIQILIIRFVQLDIIQDNLIIILLNHKIDMEFVYNLYYLENILVYKLEMINILIHGYLIHQLDHNL